MKVLSFSLSDEQATDVLEALEHIREGVVWAPEGHVFTDGDALHAMSQLIFSGLSPQDKESAINTRLQLKAQFCRDFAEKMAASGMTVQEAASAFNTAPGTITRWIYGRTAPAVYSRATIIKTLDQAIEKKQVIMSKAAETVSTAKKKSKKKGPRATNKR